MIKIIYTNYNIFINYLKILKDFEKCLDFLSSKIVLRFIENCL